MSRRLTTAERILRLLDRTGVIRPRDITALGLPRSSLQRLLERGLVERVGRGLYARAGAEGGEHRSLVEAARRVPHGVVCLLSALRFHELTTQMPYEVWLAIDVAARRPSGSTPPLRIVRMSGAARTTGVEHHVIDGVRVPVYGVAKSVADAFKFRSKVGLDVALETLREAVQHRRTTMDELWAAAKVCRVAAVMRPYLQALA